MPSTKPGVTLTQWAGEKKWKKAFDKGNISSGEQADSQTRARVHTSDHFSFHLSLLQGSEGSLGKQKF